MPLETFQALVLRREDGKTVPSVASLRPDELPEGDALVAVEYSSLNYKDGLAVTGRAGVARSFPLVPGIDLAGTVIESDSERVRPGERVLLTGWGIGERHWGGYSQLQRVRSEWLIPLPRGLDAQAAMTLGTAGLTAMLCLMALEDGGVVPDEDRPVLVTGASGGVGSISVALLAALGYRVAAVTGRPENHDYLRELGATEIVAREAAARGARPLESQRWAGGVDTVGGAILARLLAETRYGGTVAACGLAGGAELHTTVMPLILRGVGLRGIDSVQCPQALRVDAWRRLAAEMPAGALARIRRVEPLAAVPRLAEEILGGRVRGRIVIALRA